MHIKWQFEALKKWPFHVGDCFESGYHNRFTCNLMILYINILHNLNNYIFNMISYKWFTNMFQLINSQCEYITEIHGLWICKLIQFGWYLLIFPTFSAHGKWYHMNILLMTSGSNNSCSEKLPTCTFALRILFEKNNIWFE